MTPQKTKAFTQRSHLASLPSRMAAMTVICAVSLFGQTPVTTSGMTPGTTPARLTLAQAQELLKAHPELLAGFQTPQGVSVAVTEAVSGGFVFRYHGRNGYTGDMTIAGPATVIVDKGWLGGLFDSVIDVVWKLIDGDKSGGGGNNGNGNGNGSGNGNGNGNTGGCTIVVNGANYGDIHCTVQ